MLDSRAARRSAAAIAKAPLPTGMVAARQLHNATPSMVTHSKLIAKKPEGGVPAVMTASGRPNPRLSARVRLLEIGNS